jgi:serine/threonine-protein kinase
MMHVSDAAIGRLRALDDWPDFSATRYELLEAIGRGGMGVVFRARDRELERDVAIKVTQWSTDADAERLRREARTLASLEHAGVVPVHDVGRLADGRVYLVMMFVRGERLDTHTAPLPLADRLRVFDRICDAVAFAHARAVVHRDLKPANIMVGAFGQVWVLDWGLARPGSDPDSSGSGTGRDAHVEAGGTVGYMPPEASTQKVDPRADVYALGAILRELAAVPGTQIPRALTSIVRRATGSDPESRYADAAELAADVRRFADGAAVQAHRETALERAGRLARVYRTPIALVLTYLAVRVLLLLWRI